MNSFFTALKEGAHGFSLAITFGVNIILLLFVYIVGIGLSSVFARARGKHFYNQFQGEEKTYWQDMNITARSVSKSHYRQF